MSFVLALLSALWLGIQTSISPCPLATNIAAVAFLSRNVGDTKRVLLSGAMYALGRTLAYLILSVIILLALKDQLTAGSALSGFLQKYGLLALGPILILLGMVLLGMLNTGSLTLVGQGLQQKAAGGGIWWSGALGILFALSFCPASAGLFFVLLIPLAASQNSIFLLPSIYGIATAIPVIVFALLMVFANQYVAKLFGGLTVIEKWIRVVVGIIFIATGLFYSLVGIYGVNLI